MAQKLDLRIAGWINNADQTWNPFNWLARVKTELEKWHA
jgi:hypothetical protein